MFIFKSNLHAPPQVHHTKYDELNRGLVFMFRHDEHRMNINYDIEKTHKLLHRYTDLMFVGRG